MRGFIRRTVMGKKIMFLVLLITVSLSVSASADLVGYWKLNEGTGTIINDSSIYGHHGTINPWNANLVDWTAEGYKGAALEFHTTTGQPYTYVEAPLPPGILNMESATYALWMRMPQNHQPWGIIIDLIGNSDWSLEPGDAGELYNFRPWFGNTSPRFNDDQWHHVAVTFSFADNQTIIYVDGEEISRGGSGGSDSISTVRLGGPRQFAQVWASFTGSIDEVTVFNHTLSATEVKTLYLTGPAAPTLASTPSPADGAKDVPRDVVLSWEPGESVDKHDVYFGTNFDDVNDADRTNPLNVLANQGQSDETYDAGRLEFGRTYFWRIDEIEADGSTIHKGEIWSFTVELVAYPIPGQNIIATASSQVEGQIPDNTINGSGLNTEGLHSTVTETMWLSAMDDPGPVWIQYEFDKVYKLQEMLVWNYNGSSILSWYGIKEATVEYSADGTNWAQLNDVPEFTQATGEAGYAYNTTVNFDGAAAKYVKITANSGWGGAVFNQYGLSEVQFLYIPVSAREPNPAPGATGIAPDVTLSWRAGREAAEHNVLISTDEQAVIDGTTPATTVSQASHGPLSLEMGEDYYWRVDEVNHAETLTTWQSNIWSFTTSSYIVVDDFESYNDIPESEAGSNLVYLTWIDGYNNPATNGSTIGYVSGASMETSFVHSGEQSVPFTYDNGTASLSEVTASTDNLAIGRNWTKGSAQTLVLWFYGDPDNGVTERMYVKIGNTKVLYDGDAANVTRPRWNQWNIDLAASGVNQSNVAQLTIGFERTGAAGGSGTVFIDDIRLYRSAPPIPVPSDPGTANLVAYYAMNNNVQDSSGNNLNGTIVGTPTYVSGVTGMALSLDGVDDYVDCGTAANFDITEQITLAAWVNTNDADNGQHNPYITKGDQTYGLKHASNNSMEFFIYEGDWHTIQSSVDDSFNGVWHHVAGTFDGTQLKLFIDGGLASTLDYTGSIATGTYPVNLGRNSQNTDRLYEGALDEARIYNRALSEGEILYLANQ
jgi:hypothetical protein